MKMLETVTVTLIKRKKILYISLHREYFIDNET